ncbi:MAG: response regulator [Acidobacteriota bacterium]|nr:response regulator [Acidobacteriota bacterium]
MKTIRKASILYFDDEVACLEVFRQMFYEEYDVRTVSTLRDARAALAEGEIDIVIIDQQMPEIDGLTFLREVASTRPESFRMMLTGSIGLGHVIREISTGVIHLFLTKPWAEPNMRRVLERAGMPKRSLYPELTDQTRAAC